MLSTLSTRQKLTLLLLAGIALGALFFLAFTAGRVSAGPSSPGTTSADAERIYLTLMISHHEAGVEMAAAGVELASTEQVRTLAGKIEESQQAEIDVLQALLDEL